jgi:hypothetical protein
MCILGHWGVLFPNRVGLLGFVKNTLSIYTLTTEKEMDLDNMVTIKAVHSNAQQKMNIMDSMEIWNWILGERAVTNARTPAEF